MSVGRFYRTCRRKPVSESHCHWMFFWPCLCFCDFTYSADMSSYTVHTIRFSSQYLQICNFRTGLRDKNDRIVKPRIGRFSVCRPKSALWKTSANFVNCIRNILDNYLLDAYAMWTVGSIVRYFWNSCSILAMPFQVYQDISISSIICGSRLLWVEKYLNIWSFSSVLDVLQHRIWRYSSPNLLRKGVSNFDRNNCE